MLLVLTASKKAFAELICPLSCFHKLDFLKPFQPKPVKVLKLLSCRTPPLAKISNFSLGYDLEPLL